MMNETGINTLWEALRTKRPHNGKGVKQFRKYIQDTFKGYTQVVDKSDNLWIITDSKSKTLFQAHMDTVHHSNGSQNLIWTDATESIVYTPDSECLGADDGAGCAMLAHLIAEGVPATYCFTIGEECGGIGGKWIANNLKEFIKDFDRCIAFDRKGQYDICGEQMRGNCASRQFVTDLAEQLNMGHVWNRGTYTDNCEYKGIIPEIVNISIGYEDAHSAKETLNMEYMNKLAERLLLIEWAKLPVIGPAPDPIYKPFGDYWRGYGCRGNSKALGMPMDSPLYLDKYVPLRERKEPLGFAKAAQPISVVPVVTKKERKGANKVRDTFHALDSLATLGTKDILEFFGYDGENKEDAEDIKVIREAIETIVWEAYDIGLGDR